MTLSNEQLDAIRKRAEAATEGPWKYSGDKWGDLVVYSPALRGFQNNGGEIAELEGELLADAEFIAHAREDVPALLAEVDRLKSQLSELICAIYEYEENGTALMDLAERMDSE